MGGGLLPRNRRHGSFVHNGQISVGQSKDTPSAVRIGTGLLEQPVSVESTKTLRMRGRVRYFLRNS